MGAKRFNDLIVWQKAYLLSLKVRELTLSFPEKEHRHAGQMQSASESIPQNIAEGFGRRSPNDQAHYYTMAKSSANELKVQLMQTQAWGLCRDTRELYGLADELCAMLYSLRQKVLQRGSDRL
jgi:four helix bundle protein